MTQTALILGANGRFGRNAAEAFEAAGWTTRRFDRNTDDLTQAAPGADVIVNAWNPQYPDWARQVPKLTADVITAAKASGATVVIPGNVYNFGQDAPQRFAEDTPHGATNPLGRIRTKMEADYKAAGVRTIILRGGDFLDTEASGNWFDMVMAKSIAKGRFSYPGRLDAPRAWAYLPDMARALVQLAEMRGDLATFEDVPFPGYTLTGAELAKLVNDIHPAKAKRMSWLPIQIARPFWSLAKHLLEMRYLWSKPHYLDGQKFAALLPGFVPTPEDVAIASALAPLLRGTAQAKAERVTATLARS